MRVFSSVLGVFCSTLIATNTFGADDTRHEFSGSISAVGKSAKGSQGVITRSSLKPAETKASIDFSISLRMRNFDQLQSRVRKGELISQTELEADFLPDAADYAKIADWLTSEGFTLTLRDANHTRVRSRYLGADCKCFWNQFCACVHQGRRV